MGGQLATGSSIYMASAGVPAADGAGLSSIKSFSQLLTSIAAMPLAGGTFIGHVLFTDNTYDIGASGATRPRTVYAGTSVITPLLNNSNAAALTLGNSTYGVTVPGAATFSGTVSGSRFGFTGWDFRPSPSASGSMALYDTVNSREAMRLNPAGNAYFLNNVYLNATISGEAGIVMQQSGVAKWQLYDASSLFRIYNATTAADAMTIAAATSNATFAGGITASGIVSHGAYTVATLPAAGSNAGKMAQVTDSNVAASGNYGATVAAGGANRVKVFSDGTNWVIA